MFFSKKLKKKERINEDDERLEVILKGEKIECHACSLIVKV